MRIVVFVFLFFVAVSLLPWLVLLSNPINKDQVDQNVDVPKVLEKIVFS